MQIYGDSFGHLFGPHFLGFLTRPHKLGKIWVVGDWDDLLVVFKATLMKHSPFDVYNDLPTRNLFDTKWIWMRWHTCISKAFLSRAFFDGVVFLIGGHLHFVIHLLWNLHNKVEYFFTWLQWNVVPWGNLQCCYPKLFVGESRMHPFKDVVFLVSCM